MGFIEWVFYKKIVWKYHSKDKIKSKLSFFKEVLSLFCINSIVLILIPFIVWVCSLSIFIIFSMFSIRLKSLLNLRVKTLF